MNAWSTNVEGSKMYQLNKKLKKNLKHMSIKWAKNKFQHSKFQLLQVESKLIDI